MSSARVSKLKCHYTDQVTGLGSMPDEVRYGAVKANCVINRRTGTCWIYTSSQNITKKAKVTSLRFPSALLQRVEVISTSARHVRITRRQSSRCKVLVVGASSL